MIIFWLVAIPVAAGFLAWAGGRWNASASRWIAAAALGVDLALTVLLWAGRAAPNSLAGRGPWQAEVDWSWVPRFGIRFHLALDGLSLVLVALALFLGLLSVLASWTSVTRRVGFFHFNLLWVLAGIIGVFLAVDLFLFYFFWELMLVPMYFLIGIWGHENRIYASFKFFLFTQAGGLAMLVSILALHFVHAHETGVSTFDYPALLGTPLGPVAGLWIVLGFTLAFTVKIAAVPVHAWLPDAHAQAPTAGSVILAGLLLKTGAYGLIRFVLPLSSSAPRGFAPIMAALGVASILYGAKLAYAQTDFKRLVAYTSVSHMGFVVLGVFSMSALALQGAVLQIVCHGISTGALFIVAGSLQDRLHTRNLDEMGGLWDRVPRLGAAGLLFALASLGLPGLGNFVAEFLVLIGSFETLRLMTIFASLGFIASTVYALTVIQKVFHGDRKHAGHVSDLDAREVLVFAAMAAAIVWLGLYPQPVLDTAKGALPEVGARPSVHQTTGALRSYAPAGLSSGAASAGPESERGRHSQSPPSRQESAEAADRRTATPAAAPPGPERTTPASTALSRDGGFR